MTDEEIKKLIYVVKSAYSRHFKDFTDEDFTSMLITWRMCLEGYTYDVCSRAIKAYIMSDTKGFPPVPGQIIEKINLIAPESEVMGAMEAWEKVYKAICNSMYNSESEFAKLPPLCQKVLGSHNALKEMATMNADTVKSVEQSHFIRQYNEYADREKEMLKLPPNMRLTQSKQEAIECIKAE